MLSHIKTITLRPIAEGELVYVPAVVVSCPKDSTEVVVKLQAPSGETTSFHREHVLSEYPKLREGRAKP